MALQNLQIAKAVYVEPVHQDADGWWFFDESGVARFGPFKSEFKARSKLWEYVSDLVSFDFTAEAFAGPSDEELLSYEQEAKFGSERWLAIQALED